MTLKIHNSATRSKEDFRPIDNKHVRMYVCGPTVYDYAHVGNARPVVVFDTLARLLRRLYSKVTYVRNITDVDDKIIEAARASGDVIESITSRCARQFHDDMAELNDQGPDIEPRATDHIPEMVDMIQRLIDRGFAYHVDGHVLFEVTKMPEYGQLSRHSRDELIAGARVEVAPYKNDPADFILWKPSAVDQPGWDSPWGNGRPGWHLECSAMSEKHLGNTFDIHGGGQDLIFPHHENEIAQSVCAHDGAPFVKYWMHNGYLTVNGEKMSKSLGNFYTVRQLLEEGWHGETIRLALLKAHYRQPLNFSITALSEAKSELDRLYGALRGPKINELESAQLDKTSDLVQLELENDLNTPAAISRLHSIAREIFQANGSTEDIAYKKNRLFSGGHLLGILQVDPEVWFKGKSSDEGLSLCETEIEEMISKRNEARKSKDFGEADRLRDLLAKNNIFLEDGPQGTIWRRGQRNE
ncbi:MAG: cysteine--tRNA ligase [Rhodospirillaceae bacterium]